MVWWQGLPSTVATWKDKEEFKQAYPNPNLEDKVEVDRESIDRKRNGAVQKEGDDGAVQKEGDDSKQVDEVLANSDQQAEELPTGIKELRWQDEEDVESIGRPKRIIKRPSRYLE